MAADPPPGWGEPIEWREAPPEAQDAFRGGYRRAADTDTGRRRLADSAARVSGLTAALHDALGRFIAERPGTTVEECVEALLDCAAREARRLRTGQATPADQAGR